MEPIPFAISMLLVLVTIVLVGYPLWRQARNVERRSQSRASSEAVEECRARYAAALATIRDLMFDHEMGKIATDDYEALLAKAKLEAAQIQQQLANYTRQQTELDPAVATTIDALVLQQRNNGAEATADLATDLALQRSALQGEVQAELERLKMISVDHETGAPVCSHCRAVIEIGDLFCPECGQDLQAAPTKIALIKIALIKIALIKDE